MSIDKPSIHLAANQTAPAVKVAALTTDQIKFLRELLAPSVVDIDETPETPQQSLATTIWDALDHAEVGQDEGIFASVYYMQQVYGGPEEGGWYYWVKTLQESKYCDSLEAVSKQLVEYARRLTEDDSDWFDTVFDCLPSGEELFKYFSHAEELPGETALNTYTMAVQEPGARSYDDYYMLVVEYMPGAYSTVRKEFYC